MYRPKQDMSVFVFVSVYIFVYVFTDMRIVSSVLGILSSLCLSRVDVF